MTSATMTTGVPIPSSIDTSGVFCDRGTLTHFQLEAHFCRESLAPEILTLQFELVNFARIQEAPRIEIQLVSIAGVVLDTRNLELQAGKSHEEQMGVVAGFSIARVGQSTSTQSFQNEITATLVSSVRLFSAPVGALITISGLTGALTFSITTTAP